MTERIEDLGIDYLDLTGDYIYTTLDATTPAKPEIQARSKRTLSKRSARIFHKRPPSPPSVFHDYPVKDRPIHPDCRICASGLAFNIRLCKDCQWWNDARHAFDCNGTALYGGGGRPSRQLDEVRRSTSCAMCQVCSFAVLENLQLARRERAFDFSSLRVKVAGPYHFDYTNTNAKVHIKAGDGQASIVPCVIVLVVGKDPELELTDQRLARVRPGFKGSYHWPDAWLEGLVAIRVNLHYADSGRNLVLIRRVEKQYFDLPALQWRLGISDYAPSAVDLPDLQWGLTVADYAPSAAPPEKKTHMPANFRLVDCTELFVTEPGAGELQPFAALSYVWGTLSKEAYSDMRSTTMKELSSPGSLRHARLPNVIADAIILCPRIGMRYLWVDRLCIVQDNVEEKAAQVAAMDRIYSSAALTIVSVVDPSGDFGLPGVPGSGRPRQSSVLNDERAFDHERPKVVPNLRRVIDESKSNRRAWTLQERVLSRKCLVISNYQWFLVTKDRTYSEEQGPVAEYSAKTNPYSRSAPSVRPLHLVRPIDQCMEYIEHYSARELSYSDDILSAFQGICNVLAQQLQTEFHFGVPERFIPGFLLWGPAATLGVRDPGVSIPSWSWAAWTGSVRFGSVYQQLKSEVTNIGSLVRYQIVTSDATIRGLRVDEEWFGEKLSFDDLQDGQDLPNEEYKRARYWPSNTTTLWQQCLQNPWTLHTHSNVKQKYLDAAHKYPGALVFVTTAAMITLAVEASAEHLSQGPSHPYDSRASDQVVLFHNPTGQRIGRLMNVKKDWVDESLALGSSYEAIVLAAGVMPKQPRMDAWMTAAYPGSKFSVDPSWRHVWTTPASFSENGSYNPFLLHVMVVTRNGLDPDVYQRLAIGVISIQHWNECQPEWKTVILV